MLYYDTIGVSETIDINKTSTWKGFKFQLNACSLCHNILNVYEP